jgi:hypothetical protein
MTERRGVPVTWVSYGEAAWMFLGGATLRPAIRIAAVVGTWLSLMNQGSLILEGTVPWAKIALNYATPFVVASLGFLAGRRRKSVESLAAVLDEERRAGAPRAG